MFLTKDGISSPTAFLLVAVFVLIGLTPVSAMAQTLQIEHDRSERDVEGDGYIYPRAFEALKEDPTGVWDGVPEEERMNVGVAVRLDLDIEPEDAEIEDIEWEIEGNTIQDTTITSTSASNYGTGWRTQCEVEELDAGNLSGESVEFLWTTPGEHDVSVSATVDGQPQQASVTFDVRRHPKPEIFYVTGPGASPESNPGETMDDLLAEHAWWHVCEQAENPFLDDACQVAAPAAEFLRFHRGFIQKANCWRVIFGYPPVQTYLPDPGENGEGYVPQGPAIDHSGGLGEGFGIVRMDGERHSGNHDDILELPQTLTLEGDGETSLADFEDEDALTDDSATAPWSLLTWHNIQHGRICNRGDFTFTNTTPADPIFWRFHWMLTQIFEAWQLLQLDGETITVEATEPEGTTVFFPEQEMEILPTEEEGSAMDCEPASGSFFFVGNTTVDCTVRDVSLLDEHPDAPDHFSDGTTESVQFDVEVEPPDGLPSDMPLDLYLIVDLSGSYTVDLPEFKDAMLGDGDEPGFIDEMLDLNPDTRIGLAAFEDYPIEPFGLSFCPPPSGRAESDRAYYQIHDLLDLSDPDNVDLLKDTIEDLETNCGADLPESQLAALYQAALGTGEDLSDEGFPDASIPSGQQASFSADARKVFMLWTDVEFHRPGDPGDIPYPGPTFEETVDAINSLNPPKFVGIASPPDEPQLDPLPDMKAMAEGTNSFAPVGGIDCDGNGIIDVQEGEPLVCTVDRPAVNVGEVMLNSVEAVTELPVANAGPFQSIDATSPSGAAVTLDGSRSFDPEGGSLHYHWTGEHIDTMGMAPTVELPVGHHQLTLTVTNEKGNVAHNTVTVIVRDASPPEIVSVDISPDCLWPPNHKLVPYKLGENVVVDVDDPIDPDPAVRIVDITSSEPENDVGDGNTAPDVFFAPDSPRFCLRSERAGPGEGRAYQITIEARDQSGNTDTETVIVDVPHNQGQAGGDCPVLPPDLFVEDGDPLCDTSPEDPMVANHDNDEQTETPGACGGGPVPATVVFLVGLFVVIPRSGRLLAGESKI